MVSIILALYYLEITPKFGEKFGFVQEAVTESSVNYIEDEPTTEEGVLPTETEAREDRLYTRERAALEL